jgi:hypothetical protein
MHLKVIQAVVAMVQAVQAILPAAAAVALDKLA